MFCVGICDDSQEARLHLRARLERVLEPHRDMDRVLEFSSGEGLLRWVENHPGELNLIFLDMEMGQLDGMETARRLRQIEESLPLVFVTGYTEHVFEGYTVGALGYLLKPVREDQLKEVLMLQLQQMLLLLLLLYIYCCCFLGHHILPLHQHDRFQLQQQHLLDERNLLFL